MVSVENTTTRLLKRLIHPISLIILCVLLILFFNVLDKPLTSLFASWGLGDKFPALIWVTNIGNPTVYLVVFLLLGLYFRYVQPHVVYAARAWFVFLCLVVSDVVCLVLKCTFGRARPDLWLTTREYGFSWFKTDNLHRSFPSGHTTTIMTLAFALSVLFPRFKGLFLIVGLLVVISRVLLLQHFVSDVLLATYLACLEVTLLVYCLRKKQYFTQAW